MSAPSKFYRYEKQPDGTFKRTTTGRYRIFWKDHTGARRTATFPNKHEAQKALDLARGQTKTIELGLLPPPRATAPFVKDFAETFQKLKSAETKTSEQISKRSSFDRFIVPKFGARRLDEITRVNIDEWKKELRARLAPKSVNNILVHLGAMLRYALAAEMIARVPAINLLEVPKSSFTWGASKPFGVPDEEEQERLDTAARDTPALLAAVRLAQEAGLRAGEIRALKRGDVDLVQRHATVQRTDYRGELGPPKSGDPRVVPLTARTVDAVRAIQHLRGEFLFSNPDGTRWTERQLDSMILMLGVKAKIPLAIQAYDRERETRRAWKIRQVAKETGRAPSAEQLARLAAYEAEKKSTGKLHWGAHILRHAYGATLASRGAAPRAIQDLMGHESLSTTEKYLRAFGAHAARAAVDLLESRRSVPVERPVKGRRVHVAPKPATNE